MALQEIHAIRQKSKSIKARIARLGGGCGGGGGGDGENQSQREYYDTDMQDPCSNWSS